MKEEDRQVSPSSFSKVNQNDQECIAKTKYLTKDIYDKILPKYEQIKHFKITNIYDPPLTIKEIKKLRRDKRKLYKLRQTKRKQVSK